MKTRIYKAITLIIVATILFACDRNKVYEEYIEIDNNIWDNENIVNFKFNIEDTTQLYNIYINVRHSGTYQFNNLWMFVKSSAPNGETRTDTVECIFVNAENQWIGEGLGGIWDVRIPWKKNVRFTPKGEYQVSFEQAMRIDKLPNIMDVGLRVEKIPSK